MLFWATWILMPGVGVTDPGQIFTLVAPQRWWVAASVGVQLLSASLYAPALVALVARGVTPTLRRGATLLLIGAMSSAADATLHLLAFAMTVDGLDRPTLVTVMAFMQGPGLVVLAPMLLCFFVGGVLISKGMCAIGAVSRWNMWLHALALAVAIGGGALTSSGAISSHSVGIAALGLVSLAQAWSGLAWRRRAISDRGDRRGATALAVASAALLLLTAAPAHADEALATDRWPRTYVASSGSRVDIFAPQVASWDNQTHLVAYAAVAYTAPNAPKPIYGTIRVESDTRVALGPRLVSFAALEVTEASFGGVDRDRSRVMLADIVAAMPAGERVLSLDRVLAGLDTSRIRPRHTDGVKADPPAIFVSTTPAVLVAFDGDPIWSPIAGTGLRYAVNTNWDVFEHDAGRGPSRRLHAPAARRQLAGGGGQPADAAGDDEGDDHAVREHGARGADRAARRSELSAGGRVDVAPLGPQHG
jgi:hypothetical protein